MKLKIFNIAVLLVAILSTLTAISFMPDIIPVHFDINGAVDRWGSKYEMLLLPVITFSMLLLGEVSVKFLGKAAENSSDEKEKSDAVSNIKVINIVFTVVNVMFTILNFFILYNCYSHLDGVEVIEIDFMRVVTVILGASFIVMGNYMPRSRTNGMIGFRCSWSMYNDVTWQKSNRIGGYVMTIAGIVSILGGLIFGGITSIVIMLISIIASIVVGLAFSYYVYKQEKGKE